MKLEGKHILVTGGAGFIGSHLVDRLILERPASLIVVDNFFLGKDRNLVDAKRLCPSLAVYNQDATDYSAMASLCQKHTIDVVFNLAVVPLPVSLVKPAWSFMENVLLTKVLCELAREGVFTTLIHTSSSEVYGTTLHSSINESHPFKPLTPYAASKAAADLLVESYTHTFGLDMAIVRPFNNYGPRQNEESYAGVIPLTLKRVFRGESPVIESDGEQTRDFIYVTDTADAFVRVYETPETRGKTLNLGSGCETSIKTLVTLILRSLDSSLPIVYQPQRPGDVRKHLADVSLAKQLIDFQSRVSFTDGLQKTVDWYKEILS